jgi:hypothetical protein
LKEDMAKINGLLKPYRATQSNLKKDLDKIAKRISEFGSNEAGLLA